MLENPFGEPTCVWTNQEHHAIALNAARKSITLLKNDGVLPLDLSNGDELVVAGPRATWPHQNNDPNVIWQSIYYDNPQAKNYLQAITTRANQSGIQVYADDSDNPKVAVVVIGENSYTHGTEWADKNPNIPEEQLSVIRDFHERGVKVVTVIILPRPYVLTPLIELSNAIMVVYRGGNGIAQATAESIFGDFAPTGKLPFQMPRSLEQLGSDNVNDQVEKWELPYDLGATNSERALIRSYIEQDLPVPPIFGDPLFQYGFGLQNFGQKDDTSTGAVLYPDNKHDNQVLSVRLYPNPVRDNLYINILENNQGMRLSIYDFTGKTVHSEQFEGSFKYIDLSFLTTGIYYLTINNNQSTATLKFMKQ